MESISYLLWKTLNNFGMGTATGLSTALFSFMEAHKYMGTQWLLEKLDFHPPEHNET